MSRVENREKKAARLQRQKRENQHKKRKVIGTILGLGITAGVVGTAAFERFHTEPQPRPALSSSETIFDNDSLIVQREIERRGIEISETEQALWADAYQYTGDIMPINEQTAQVAVTRLYDTLDLMLLSENPHYREAATQIDQLGRQGLLSLHMTDIAKELQGGDLVTQMSVEDQQIKVRLGANIGFILNYSNALTLADTIAHEAKHYQNSRKRWEEEQPRGEGEIEAWLAAERDPQAVAQEEARGYASAAEAYITQFGLLGYDYTEGLPTGGDERAAQYIRYGSNESDPNWINYIDELYRNIFR